MTQDVTDQGMTAILFRLRPVRPVKSTGPVQSRAVTISIPSVNSYGSNVGRADIFDSDRQLALLKIQQRQAFCLVDI
jgi:hypothetical protein